MAAEAADVGNNAAAVVLENDNFEAADVGNNAAVVVAAEAAEAGNKHAAVAAVVAVAAAFVFDDDHLKT